MLFEPPDAFEWAGGRALQEAQLKAFLIPVGKNGSTGGLSLPIEIAWSLENRKYSQ